MPKRQILVFNRPRRRSSRSSRGSLGIVVVGFAVIIFLAALGYLIQFLQTPSGLVTVIVIIGILVGVFVLRKRQQITQRQAWQMQQQQQTTWQFNQQQEAARKLYAQQEWERQEKERQEQERIARMKSLGDILVLTPGEFEKLTGKILEANGFHDV